MAQRAPTRPRRHHHALRGLIWVSATGADAEYLHGVCHIHETVNRRGLIRSCLDRRAHDLDGVSAPTAHQVMVVRLAARTVKRFAICTHQHIDLATNGKESEGAVDGGQPHVRALTHKQGMKLLGTAELIHALQQLPNGGPLWSRSQFNPTGNRVVVVHVVRSHLDGEHIAAAAWGCYRCSR